MKRKTETKPLAYIMLALCCVLAKPAAATGSATATAIGRIEQIRTLNRAFSSLAERLDPSPEQRGQIALILLSEAPAGLTMVEKMLANRNQLLSLTQGGNFPDETRLAKLAEAQGRLVTDLILWKENVKIRIRDVLTPEQQASLDAWLAEFQQRLVGQVVEQLPE